MEQVTAGGGGNQTPQESFISKFISLAFGVQQKYGIPVSVTLAQAAHESGWGKSGLTKSGNNFFGIKGKGDAGSVFLPTWEEVNGQKVTTMAAFAAYSTPEAAFDAYGKLVSGYSTVKASNKADPYAVLNSIKAAGYATDSAYVGKVSSIMQDYKLTQYDTLAPGTGSSGLGDSNFNPSDYYDVEQTGLTFTGQIVRIAFIGVLGIALIFLAIQLLPVNPVKAITKGAGA